MTRRTAKALHGAVGLVVIGLVGLCLFPSRPANGQEPGGVPDRRPFESLWADYDPRQEPLDAKVVREWEEGGIVLRYVLYRIGTQPSLRNLRWEIEAGTGLRKCARKSLAQLFATQGFVTGG